MRRPVGVLTALAVALALPALPAAAAAKAPTAAQLAGAQKKANQAATRLARAQTELARAETGVSELEARTALTGNRLTSLQGQVRSLAVSQYVRGGDAVDWMSGGDLGNAARGRTMLRYVSVVQADAVDGYRVARLDLEAARGELAGRLASQRTTVSRLRGEQAKVRAELDKLATLQRAYEARARADRKAAGARVPVVGGLDIGRILGSGPWICPVQGTRAFSNDWGQARSGGRRHQGNDMLAPRGTPIVASVAGTVQGRSGGLGGVSYYLKGDDGTTYYGAHLDRLGATGRVAAGAVIGSVGNSGNARGGPPHLHFEVHPGGGRAVNPFSLLSRFC